MLLNCLLKFLPNKVAQTLVAVIYIGLILVICTMVAPSDGAFRYLE